MTENKHLTLLKELLEIDTIEQNKKLRSDSSLFEILGKVYDENLSSRMLAYVLKNDKSFVWKLFVFYGTFPAGSCPTDFEVKTVECEKSMWNGRADIFVVATLNQEIYTLTIENKIYASEHGEQTQTYYEFVSRNHKDGRNAYLFLKPYFNPSPASCKEFTPIYYSDLIEMISETDDYRIKDFKRHVERFLTMKDIQFTEVDKAVLRNLTELRGILNSTEEKLATFKLQLFDALCRNQAIAGLEYNPNVHKAKSKSDKEVYWESFKDNKDFVVEIADNDTSFRIYRADEWYQYNSTNLNEAGYYFYVELKFDENNPHKILFQGVVNRYGKVDKNIVTKFVKETDFGNLKNPALKDEGHWFIFSAKEFQSSYEVLSKEWQEELFHVASQTLSEYLVEMDGIFTRFQEWRTKRN